MLILEPNLLKYNCRMAQVMQWPQAIWNYMKKVRWKYQHVPPPHPGKNSAGFVARPLIAAIHKLCLCVCLLGLFSVIQHSGQKMARRKKAEVSEDGGPFIGGWARVHSISTHALSSFIFHNIQTCCQRFGK